MDANSFSDAAGNNNITGSPSLYFDGTNDYVDTGVSGGDMSAGVSMSFDVKDVTPSGSAGTIISKYNHTAIGGSVYTAVKLYTDNNGVLWAMIRNSGSSSGIEKNTGINLRDGSWHNIKFTWWNNIDRLKIWVDNVLTTITVIFSLFSTVFDHPVLCVQNPNTLIHKNNLFNTRHRASRYRSS